LIGNVIQLVTNGIVLAEFRPDDTTDELEIRVRYPIKNRNLGQLDELRVPTSNGLVPVSNFLTLAPAPRTGVIQRVDAQRVITIQSDVAEGVLADDILKQLKDKLASGPQDPTVGIKFKGEAADHDDDYPAHTVQQLLSIHACHERYTFFDSWRVVGSFDYRTTLRHRYGWNWHYCAGRHCS